MKKIIAMIIFSCLSISLFAGNNGSYYEYENKKALSVGLGYDYYKMSIDEESYDSFTIKGMTLNIKAEMPLKVLSGISLFLDTSFMIPSTSSFNPDATSISLKDSTHLSDITSIDGTPKYILLDNNLGLSMLGTITPSFFFYLGGGLDVMLGHSYYKYSDGSNNQTLMYGYLGIGVFQSSGVYYEFTNNIALNVGINTSYDFLIYNYQKGSADSISNKFEKIDAKGNNYLGRVMLTYNF